MLEAPVWSSSSLPSHPFFHYCFGQSAGGKIDHPPKLPPVNAALSSVPRNAHHFSWRSRQIAARQKWQLCAMWRRNSEMHRAEDLACKLSPLSMPLINPCFQITNSLLPSQYNTILLTIYLSSDFTSLLPSLFPPLCHLPPGRHVAWTNRNPNILYKNWGISQDFTLQGPSDMEHLFCDHHGKNHHWPNTFFNLMEGSDL